MSKYIVRKSNELKGKVRIYGAKNSALPIIAAGLLTPQTCIFNDIPPLSDINDMCSLLYSMGCEVHSQNNAVIVKANNINRLIAPYELTNRFRASFLVTGPLLAKYGYAKISLPGGCPIGTRPIDLHLKGFSALGAEISRGSGYIELKAKNLKGTKIYLDFPSVGATENLMMAACLADGQTIIENAAVEPEITDLANCLIGMGADIKGAGTDTVKINGVRELGGVTHCVIPDRIEAGTYMAAVAVTGGSIVIENVVTTHLKPIIAKLTEIGADITEHEDNVVVTVRQPLKPSDVKTLPFPGFPTDMQAQITTLMSVIEGTSVVIETVFENRFLHTCELMRMGANIKVDGRVAVIEGVKALSGAQVQATDLRAGAALVIAGLAAEGETEITDIEHIDRGYYMLEDKLNTLGADITRVN